MRRSRERTGRRRLRPRPRTGQYLVPCPQDPPTSQESFTATLEKGRPRLLGRDGWDWREARRLCVSVAVRYVRTRDEAEDIAHDALLRAWRFRASLRSPDQARA